MLQTPNDNNRPLQHSTTALTAPTATSPTSPIHCGIAAMLCALMLLAIGLWTAPAVADNTEPAAQLVIVMDDLGNNLQQGRRAIELPGAITYAILPHTPAAKKLAYYAGHVDERKEVIIHMPMEANASLRPGPGALETQQNRETFIETIAAAVDAVPLARGLNNHMGSAVTSLPDRMRWLMEELRQRDFYFIDSRTTKESAATSAAQMTAIPHLARDVFLDHHQDYDAIDRSFQKSIRIARQKGLAVLLAHPYDATLEYLEHRLPELAGHGITLVSASEAIQSRQQLLDFAADEFTTNLQLAEQLDLVEKQ